MVSLDDERGPPVSAKSRTVRGESSRRYLFCVHLFYVGKTVSVVVHSLAQSDRHEYGRLPRAVVKVRCSDD
jgi:hypothetical protein